VTARKNARKRQPSSSTGEQNKPPRRRASVNTKKRNASTEAINTGRKSKKRKTAETNSAYHAGVDVVHQAGVNSAHQAGIDSSLSDTPLMEHAFMQRPVHVSHASKAQAFTPRSRTLDSTTGPRSIVFPVPDRHSQMTLDHINGSTISEAWDFGALIAVEPHAGNAKVWAERDQLIAPDDLSVKPKTPSSQTVVSGHALVARSPFQSSAKYGRMASASTNKRAAFTIDHGQDKSSVPRTADPIISPSSKVPAQGETSIALLGRDQNASARNESTSKDLASAPSYGMIHQTVVRSLLNFLENKPANRQVDMAKVDAFARRVLLSQKSKENTGQNESQSASLHVQEKQHHHVLGHSLSQTPQHCSAITADNEQLIPKDSPNITSPIRQQTTSRAPTLLASPFTEQPSRRPQSPTFSRSPMFQRRTFANSNGSFFISANNNNNADFIDYSLTGTPTPITFPSTIQHSSPTVTAAGAGIAATVLYQPTPQRHHNNKILLQQSPIIAPSPVLRSPLQDRRSREEVYSPTLNAHPSASTSSFPALLFSPQQQMMQQQQRIQQNQQQIPRTFTFPQKTGAPGYDLLEFPASPPFASAAPAAARSAYIKDFVHGNKD
jgi:hypothetical protein